MVSEDIWGLIESLVDSRVLLRNPMYPVPKGRALGHAVELFVPALEDSLRFNRGDRDSTIEDGGN